MARQSVVVGLRYGVELVVMTSSTGDRGSQKDTGRRVNLFVNQVRLKLNTILLVEILGAHRKKRRRNQIFSPLIVGRCGQQITGDLLLHELVVRLVLVERINHEVTVSPAIVG